MTTCLGLMDLLTVLENVITILVFQSLICNTILLVIQEEVVMFQHQLLHHHHNLQVMILLGAMHVVQLGLKTAMAVINAVSLGHLMIQPSTIHPKLNADAKMVNSLGVTHVALLGLKTATAVLNVTSLGHQMTQLNITHHKLNADATKTQAASCKISVVLQNL